MCNDPKSFDDLANLEENIWDEDAPAPRPSTSQHTMPIGDVEVPGFVEDCPKCHGRGYINIYRRGGGYGQIPERRDCFKCKGEGKLQFKTSPEARQKARAGAQRRSAAKAEAAVEALPQAIREWLTSNNSDFAQSLLSAVRKYGSLTEKQEAAVYKCIARDEDSKVGFANWCDAYPGVLEWLKSETEAGNEFAGSLLEKGQRFGTLTDGQLNAVLRNLEEGKQSDEPETQLDLSDLPAGRYAVPGGETRLKLLVRKPGKRSKWYGWTFVSDDAAYGSRKTYGKQAPDGLYKGGVVEQLQAIIADPMEASIAYGKLVGVCGVCNRRLEDEKSIAAGIGPVCAGKLR